MIDAPAKVALTIRPITLEELPLCLPFGPAFMQEKDLPGKFSEEIFLKNWTLFLSAYPSVIFGLWHDKDLVGGIGGMIHPDLNTGVRYAVEFFWYVDPAHRNTLGAARLPLTFKKWGKRNGAERWKMIRILKPGEDVSAVKLEAFYVDALKMTPNEVVFDGPL